MHDFGIDFLLEFQQVTGSFFNLTLPHFYLYSSPSSIRQGYDRIGFQTGFITIMSTRFAKLLRVDAQIPDAHGFEQITKGIEIAQQALRVGMKRRYCDGLIDT